ncbi:hypothetical protein [Mesorhizobium sp. B1-1-8]|uniref:hypothetical protein n=1 Tax=Mesorhizobium sp. B1-1-8 TaxID=2589976 RepID=UPI0011285F03|nr:hypothetical protein [Mesorhizobium sp. B1-1-8]UCI06480.1 hypothetical protein FJ974_22090 [Mesorhizobium sp. B1-1-8]
MPTQKEDYRTNRADYLIAKMQAAKGEPGKLPAAKAAPKPARRPSRPHDQRSAAANPEETLATSHSRR